MFRVGSTPTWSGASSFIIFIIDTFAYTSDRKWMLIDDDLSPVDIRAWKQFSGLYKTKFTIDPESFFAAMFERRESWLSASDRSLAGTVFGISSSRLALQKKIKV